MIEIPVTAQPEHIQLMYSNSMNKMVTHLKSVGIGRVQSLNINTEAAVKHSSPPRASSPPPQLLPTTTRDNEDACVTIME